MADGVFTLPNHALTVFNRANVLHVFEQQCPEMPSDPDTWDAHSFIAGTCIVSVAGYGVTVREPINEVSAWLFATAQADKPYIPGNGIFDGPNPKQLQCRRCHADVGDKPELHECER